MRKYLLFCGVVTVIVVAGAYFYKNACAQKQERETAVLNTLIQQQAKLLEYKIRDNLRTIDFKIKANPKFQTRGKAVYLLETAYDNYTESIATCRVGRNYEPTMNSGVLYQKTNQEDIEKYRAARNFLKKYYQDSLLQNSIFYTNEKNWIQSNSTHETAMAYFFKNYKKYSPAQQYTWIDSDRLYWQHNFERFTGYVANDISEKTETFLEYVEKQQKFCALMSPNEMCSSTKKPFEASFSIVALNKSEHLKYVFNEHSIKSKNGQVVFKIPSGAASDDLKTMVMTATITNPRTGESSTAMGKQQYHVFK